MAVLKTIDFVTVLELCQKTTKDELVIQYIKTKLQIAANIQHSGYTCIIIIFLPS